VSESRHRIARADLESWTEHAQSWHAMAPGEVCGGGGASAIDVDVVSCVVVVFPSWFVL
jgi:hypothetical protein